MQFDVYRNAGASKSRAPLLVDIQSDVLAGLATRVVIPLVRPSLLAGKPIRDLHIEVTLGGKRYVALGSELAAIPAERLGPRVGTLAARRAELLRAVEVLQRGP